MPPRKRLGQLLLEIGVIDEHQLQSALGHQKQWGGKLGAVLVQKGFAKEDQVVAALSTHLGMPLVKLATQKVDARAIKYVSRQVAEKLHVFPYEVTGSGRAEVLTVAMSDPTDLSAVDQLAFHTGKRVKTMLAGDNEIAQAIALHYGVDEKKAAPPAAPAAPQPPAAQGPQKHPSAPGKVPRAAPHPPAARPRPAAPAHPPPSMEIPDAAAPADGGVEGLEPIAAHSQFGEGVAGQEEIAGDGSAADAVEGLESASLAYEQGPSALSAEPMEGLEPIAAHAPAADPWGAPAGTGWDAAPPQSGSWDPGQLALDAPLSESERLPTGAILGAVPAVPDVQPGAPDGWTSPGAPHGWSEPAPSGPTGWTQPIAPAPSGPTGWTQPIPAPPLEEAAPGGDELTPPPMSPAIPAGIVAQEYEPPPAAQEAEAPAAWAASEDPLATAPQAIPPVASSPMADGFGPEGEGPAYPTERFAVANARAPSAADEIEVDFEEEERTAAGAIASDGAPPPSPERDETEPGEGWIAPSVPSPGWAGHLPVGGLLSPADAGTLASLGIEAHDAVGAMRLLAALVRILNRRQLLDLEEIAAEVRAGPNEGLHGVRDPEHFDERA